MTPTWRMPSRKACRHAFAIPGSPAMHPLACWFLGPKWRKQSRRRRQPPRTPRWGPIFTKETSIGPLASKAQFEKVQQLIRQGIEEGATLVAGGLGRPDGIPKGYFVKPTVFADVRNDMTIAREEIFGPVLCIISYEDEDDAVRIANDTPYGLSAFVTSGDIERARRVAKRIRSGNVHINGARVDFGGCFGGYKQSGNGREWGEAGLEEFLELKAIFGYATLRNEQRCYFSAA